MDRQNIRHQTLLTVKDIQQRIGCGQHKAYQIIHSPTFPSIQIGKNYYVTVDQFDRWLERHAYKSIKL